MYNDVDATYAAAAAAAADDDDDDDDGDDDDKVDIVEDSVNGIMTHAFL